MHGERGSDTDQLIMHAWEEGEELREITVKAEVDLINLSTSKTENRAKNANLQALTRTCKDRRR